MSILNNLPAPAGAPAAAMPQTPPPTLNPLIRGLATGQIPGLNIPHGYQNPEAEALLKPALAVGLKLFKPVHDKSIQVAVVNPQKVNVEALRVADHHNTLQKLFPSIANFFPHQEPAKAPAKDTAAAGAAPPVTPTASAPAQAPTTGSPPNEPSSTPVPVLPKPVKATAALTNDRVKNLNPGTPTSRAIPGGGLVLNGLLKQVV